MKKNFGPCLMLLDMSKKKNVSVHEGLSYQLKNAVRTFYVTLAAFFAFSGLAFAQTSASNSSAKSDRDVSYKLREEKKENREEKRSIRAVEGISTITKDLFNSDFPKAKNISWSAPAGFDEADFTLNNKKMMAFFDFDNHLIGTGKYVPYDKLPAKGIEEIAKKYKGYTPEKTMYYDDNENNGNNLDIFGVPMDEDAYFTLEKNGSKEIVLKISEEGNVTFFSSLR